MSLTHLGLGFRVLHLAWSEPFCLLSLHVLSFWPFCRFMSFNFGILWLHLLSCRLLWLYLLPFWPFVLSIAFMSALCGSISHFGILRLHLLSLWFLCGFISLHFLPFVALFPCIFCLLSLISFHFGFLWLYLLPFWPFVASFAFMSAFCGFFSFHFSLLWLHLHLCRLFVASSSVHFWPFVALSPFIFCLLWLHFLPFWVFAASSPFILGLLWLYFLSF